MLGTGQPTLALKLHAELYELAKRKFPSEHPVRVNCTNNLAFGYYAVGQPEQAIPLYLELLGVLERTKRNRLETYLCKLSLVEAMIAAGRIDLALPFCQEVHESIRVTLPPNHPDRLACAVTLCKCYISVRKLDLLIPLARDTFAVCTDRLGTDHPLTLASQSNWAEALLMSGDVAKSIAQYEAVLESSTRTMGKDHPFRIRILNNLGNAWIGVKRWDKAISLFEDGIRQTRVKFGDDCHDIQMFLANLGIAYLEAGEARKGTARLSECLDRFQKQFGVRDPRFRQAAVRLCSELSERNHHAAVVPITRKVLALFDSPDEPDRLMISGLRLLLGGALVVTGDYVEGEVLLLNHYRDLAPQLNGFPPSLAWYVTDALQPSGGVADGVADAFELPAATSRVNSAECPT